MSMQADNVPRKTRKTTVNYGRRRSIRFGVAEERAVDSVRRAMALAQGVDLDEVDENGRPVYKKAVPFSVAHRRLLLDQPGANRVRARAEAMASGRDRSVRPVAIPDGVINDLAECRKSLSYTQGLARRVVFDDDPDGTKRAALVDYVQENKILLAAIEKRIGDALSG